MVVFFLKSVILNTIRVRFVHVFGGFDLDQLKFQGSERGSLAIPFFASLYPLHGGVTG